MLIDLETVILILLIIFFIYNYFNLSEYNLFDKSCSLDTVIRGNIFKSTTNYFNKSFDENNILFPSDIIPDHVNTTPSIQPINTQQSSTFLNPDIEIESFDSIPMTADSTSITTNLTKPLAKDINADALPHDTILNDRYNPLVTIYDDNELHKILDLDTTTKKGMTDHEYNDMLAEEISNDIEQDIDNKILQKSKRVQKIGKDSYTIAANFGRNALLESYAGEIDFYEELRTPWWSE